MRRTRRPVRALLCLIVACAAAGAAAAIEIERGDIRLTLHTDSSRFSIAARDGDRWVPLLFSRDPRTSALDIRVDNRVIRIGDSGNFSQRVVRTDYGADYLWTSTTLDVTQRFEFIRSDDSTHENGIEITVTVRNRAEQPVDVAARLLLDTYLGEETNTHFVTDRGDRIATERAIDAGSGIRFVRSVATPDDPIGLQIMVADAQVTAGTLSVANWRRLTEATWAFQANDTRNFNRLPYSINDSAALIVYEPQTLRTGEVYRVVARVGLPSNARFLDPTTTAATTRDTDLTGALIDRVRLILKRIDEISESDTVTAEEVETLRAELRLLSELIRGR
ncbi:MAG: hypothetical protein EA382_08710 [Spirochaetaceae bacterium]|nr:MAG: hypothetical protein EA382_08710 [Spirochaetaceae bacterium]